MSSSDNHDEVRRVTGEITRAIDQGRSPCGPLESQLALACRRAVLADLGHILARAIRSTVLAAGTLLRGMRLHSTRRDRSSAR